MSKKTQECYLHVFKFIEKNICSLECNTFVTDYERAMKNAIHILYPNAILTSCWFHFTQAVRKNASQFPHFYELIRRNSDAAFIYRQFQCIPLIKEKNIKPAFEELCAKANRLNRRDFAPFIKYFNKQWIEKVCWIKIGNILQFSKIIFLIIHRM